MKISSAVRGSDCSGNPFLCVDVLRGKKDWNGKRGDEIFSIKK